MPFWRLHPQGDFVGQGFTRRIYNPNLLIFYALSCGIDAHVLREEG